MANDNHNPRIVTPSNKMTNARIITTSNNYLKNESFTTTPTSIYLKRSVCPFYAGKLNESVAMPYWHQNPV